MLYDLPLLLVLVAVLAPIAGLMMLKRWFAVSAVLLHGLVALFVPSVAVLARYWDQPKVAAMVSAYLVLLVLPVALNSLAAMLLRRSWVAVAPAFVFALGVAVALANLSRAFA